MRSPVAAVLLDADGVLQVSPAGWVDDLKALVPAGRGDDFARDVFAAEIPAMTGDREFPQVLGEVARRWDLECDVKQLLQHWHRIEVSAATIDLVAELRSAGMRCYLASNQHAYRAEHMRGGLGYDELFDGQFYSCDLGLTKSSPEFFSRVVDALDVPAGRVLFVDDNVKYVEAAAAAGLRAEQWSIDDGIEALRTLLARHGVPIRSETS